MKKIYKTIRQVTIYFTHPQMDEVYDWCWDQGYRVIYNNPIVKRNKIQGLNRKIIAIREIDKHD